jgi:hypothetical protein
VEPGHLYGFDAGVIKIGSVLKWYPIIFDVTQKDNPQRVLPVHTY